MPDLPGPKKAKAFPVPSDHGLGLDDDECGAPAGHTPHSQAQRSRSSGINFGFFTERCRTPSWCRSARFSNWRAARGLKNDNAAYHARNILRVNVGDLKRLGEIVDVVARGGQ